MRRRQRGLEPAWGADRKLGPENSLLCITDGLAASISGWGPWEPAQRLHLRPQLVGRQMGSSQEVE